MAFMTRMTERWLVMVWLIALLISLGLFSGCCVSDTFMYEPSIDERLERERDLKSHPVLLPGVGFTA